MERLTVRCLVCTNCGMGDQCKVCQYVSVSYVVDFTCPCPTWYMCIVFYTDEPHSGNSSVSDPHTQNVNVSEPPSGDVNVSEPHTQNVNVSEPHSGNVNVSEPTVECSVSVCEVWVMY